MKAIQVNQAGGIEQLVYQECPAPPCGPDDVLIKIHATGVNYIDIYIRTGLYKPPHYPYIPGKEGSGVVAAVGQNVKELKAGDRVAFCSSGSGTYAEFAVLPAEQVVAIPEGISFEIAAASMLQGLTAYYLSHLTIQLHKGHTVLIHAGAGGVGLLLIQMAKMLGATVITTVSNDEKANLASKAGADEVIVYTQESFYDGVMKMTHQLGVHVVYDAVGKTTFDDSLKSLTYRGMLVLYGQASGPVPPLDLSRLSEKSLFLTRPVLWHYAMTKTALSELSSALFKLIIENKLNVTIGQHYSLPDAGKAHADLESRKTVGKSILIVE